MKIRTSKLQGIALDYMVAGCEARDKSYLDHFAGGWHLNRSLRYSTNPAQAWPIIDRERIYIKPNKSNKLWRAYVIRDHGIEHSYLGETGLIAAMRCRVSITLGETVEIPDELML